MVRRPVRKGKSMLGRSLTMLLAPLVALPLITSCAEQAERRDTCDRPVNCKDKRPLPILY